MSEQITVTGHAYPQNTWVPCDDEGFRVFDVEPEPMTEDEVEAVLSMAEAPSHADE